jgi:hypothetical protein
MQSSWPNELVLPNEELRADAGTDRGMAEAKIALQLGLTF